MCAQIVIGCLKSEPTGMHTALSFSKQKGCCMCRQSNLSLALSQTRNFPYTLPHVCGCILKSHILLLHVY